MQCGCLSTVKWNNETIIHVILYMFTERDEAYVDASDYGEVDKILT